MLAIDMLKMYVGVEHYYEYDELGNCLESKCISVYYLDRELKTNKSSRMTLVNLETADTIYIDQNGDALDYESDDREIEEVTDLYSFKDTVDVLIDSTKDIVSDMENGKESLDYFLILQNHMKKMEQEHNPAYLEADCLEGIIGMLPNIYTLSYGNPLTHESKIRCLYNFRRGGNNNE